MIDSVWYWVLIGIFSVIVLIWLIFAIYRGIRFEVIQAFGYVFFILGLSFTLGEYLPIPYYQYIAGSLTILGMVLILSGLISSQHRWIKKKGIKDLNNFRNLWIYAYVRHPIAFGTVILSFSLIFLASSILSNIFAVMSVIAFFLASYEKDNYYSGKYGYPYRTYIRKVPRFNIIWGAIKSLRKSSDDDKEKSVEIVYE